MRYARVREEGPSYLQRRDRSADLGEAPAVYAGGGGPFCPRAPSAARGGGPSEFYIDVRFLNTRDTETSGSPIHLSIGELNLARRPTLPLVLRRRAMCGPGPSARGLGGRPHQLQRR